MSKQLFTLAHQITRNIKGSANYQATFSLVLKELNRQLKYVSLDSIAAKFKQGLNVFIVNNTEELLSLLLEMPDLETALVHANDYAPVTVLARESSLAIKTESTYIELWETFGGLNGEVIISGNL